MKTLSTVIYAYVTEFIERNGHFDRDCADMLIDTPDMLDIRAALWDMSHPSKWLTTDGPETAHRQILAAYFQPHVIDWIMAHGEAQP
jgi:hypothetical protein